MQTDLYEKLTRLQWLLHRQQMRGYQRGNHLADATRGQGRILAALQMKDGISTKDLSYLLGLAVSSLNEFLAKLEKGGYIMREPSPEDGRVMLVHLTDKGRDQQFGPDAPDLDDIFSCLTADEQFTFGTYLDKIIDAIETDLGDYSDAPEWTHEARAQRERMAAEMFARFGEGRGDGRDFRRDFREEMGRMFGGQRGFGHDGRGSDETRRTRGFGHESRNHDEEGR